MKIVVLLRDIFTPEDWQQSMTWHTYEFQSTMQHMCKCVLLYYYSRLYDNDGSDRQLWNGDVAEWSVAVWNSSCLARC